jgi:hypothetical protein
MSPPKVRTHRTLISSFTDPKSEVIDNHFAALGTSLEGHLDLDVLAEDLEKEKATEAFLHGEVREAPTDNHVPVVDEDGFVDRREGQEDWPMLWQPDKETLADYVIPGSETVSANSSEKQILQPRTRKRARLVLEPISTITAPTGRRPVRSPVHAPGPLTIRKKNKRNARDSFVTKSTINTSKPDGKPHMLSCLPLPIHSNI